MAGGKEQTRVGCSVKGLVEDVFTCLCRDFARDGITVTLAMPADLLVHVVPIQIQQVFMNLILNAREAMLPQGGTLTLSAEERGDRVRVTIRDNGRGISPEDMERIFTSFYSTKDSSDSTTECCGTGLGLAFCRTVIDAHAGTISVRSTVGQGTTFEILLPAAQASGNA
jgi:signal transduction histidine kinase